MRIGTLVDGTTWTVRGSESTDIRQVVVDSNRVTAGCLFIAIKGIARDGHDFLCEAAARGASALVVEDEMRTPRDFAGCVVVVPDARAALNQLASRFFGEPGRELFCVGVTGTDGKTTVTWMTEAVLAAVGVPTGVIGTIDHHVGAHTWPGDTTPPPLVLQERLARFVCLGARAVALEATSQGLSQSRVGSVPFDVAVFTNLTRDHLDYHHTIESYFAAKERLFTEALAGSQKARRLALINIDTPHGARIRIPTGVTRWTYGRRGCGADLEYEALASGLTGSVVRLHAAAGMAELRLPMMGDFNGANALAAVAVGMAAGHEFHSCVEALRRFPGVPGRVQRIVHDGHKAVFVDYAHDPDAFEKLLPTVRAAMQRERPGGRLVTVFGCGGDRDRGKRPLMLRAALAGSDRVIVTSDNPRSEDPRAIVGDMFTGHPAALRDDLVVVELDRAMAIRLALQSTTERDVVMILGKGHEASQIIGAEHVPHSDVAVAEAELRRDSR